MSSLVMRPFANEFRSLLRAVDQFPRQLTPELPGMFQSSGPAVDVFETDTCYQVEAELPGYDKNDINVEYEGNQIKLSCERSAAAEKSEPTEVSDETQVSQVTPKYWVRERACERFRRTFTFPHAIQPDTVKAAYSNGILRLVVPKTGQTSEHRIPIE